MSVQRKDLNDSTSHKKVINIILTVGSWMIIYCINHEKVTTTMVGASQL